MAYTPDFEIVHIGVNCANAAEAENCAEQFASLFQLAVNPAKESADARFTGTQIEWMKAPGRGKNGHIAIRTNSVELAVAELAKKGFAYDESSAKYKNGRMTVAYLKDEFGGFAVHLLQK